MEKGAILIVCVTARLMIDMNDKEYKPTDFVQVEHQVILESGEPATIWRNALYVMNHNGNHVVIYSDGTKHSLHSGIRTRKAIL